MITAEIKRRGSPDAWLSRMLAHPSRLGENALQECPSPGSQALCHWIVKV